MLKVIYRGLFNAFVTLAGEKDCFTHPLIPCALADP